MIPFWKRLWRRSPSRTDPPEKRPEVSRLLDPKTIKPRTMLPMVGPENRNGYPNTYRAVVGDARRTERPEFFEPALLQFVRAFRSGDPPFPDAATAHAWYDARQQVIDHLLQMITRSPWNDHLVLRGSLLLKAWLGDAAREPGDMDWVFRPAHVGLEDPLAYRLFEDLIAMVSARFDLGNVVVRAEAISVDNIWTYERAAGRRIVFPWKADDLPPGHVQMDIAFRQELFTEPVRTPVPSAAGSPIPVWAADKALSLAWKLLWLETDLYPQGKDLYDATLLAEQAPLSLDLLYRVLRTGDWQPTRLSPDFPQQWEVDWENFRREYPWVTGEAKDWQDRLTAALSPMFSP